MLSLKAFGFKSADDIPAFDIPGEPLLPITSVLRTPASQFATLADFPFSPRYIESRSHAVLRIHYVEAGPKDAAETILLMHGEPSWCYLYRHMIPILARAGFRVVAPDLVGFGRSDKPAKRGDYSYERQVDWMSDFVVAAGLNNVTLFAQDWGGLIGLRVAARYPDRFLRIAISNTALPVGGDTPLPTSFKLWAAVVSQQLPEWGMLVSGGTAGGLSEGAMDAYNAPFPEEKYKPATRVYPQLVPQTNAHMSVEENKGAWRRVYCRWDKPLITLFGDSDAISKGGERTWIEQVPGAEKQKHAIIKVRQKWGKSGEGLGYGAGVI